MPRTKRSLLPPVTELDVRASPELLRRTPNGGWAWKCAYCGRYASDRSVQGKFLCRCHGGSTPRQRDLLQTYLHLQRTGRKLRTPGRPLLHGYYARRPSVSIAEVLAEYHERQAKQVRAERQWIKREIASARSLLESLTPRADAGQVPESEAGRRSRIG